MAKKTTKKKTTKKPASRAARTTKKTTKKTAKKTAKRTTKKPAAKKTTRSTVKKKVTKVAKKTTKKTTTKKPVSKKTTAKKTSKKSTAKKKTTKKPVSKPAAKKTTTKKTSKKIETKSKSASSKKPTAAGTAKSKPAAADPKKGNEQPKRMNRRRPSRPKAPLVLPDRPLLGSAKNLKPLIASGASSRNKKSVLDGDKPKKIKSPYNKRQLDAFKLVLLAKRAELLGDITHLEDEALKSGSGDPGHTSNHISEQGSDNYDQALNLNLASADRNLVIEIDEALERIVDRTYGACAITGEPIKKARLEELPWAKYSIAAARELDARRY